MRIVDVRERLLPVSRYADLTLPSGGLTTSVVAVITDVLRDGKPVTGYGYASVGRYGQSGLIRERFAPRLLNAATDLLIDEAGNNLDPFRAWRVMMTGEKAGGHGERCVAVGALDMAIWDAVSKIAGVPLYRYLANRLHRDVADSPQVRVYASGGYLYPTDDIANLSNEIRRFLDLGFEQVKIKIGSTELDRDLKRIEAVAQLSRHDQLSVDAMNAYDIDQGLKAVSLLAPLQLRWFEDLCDPLDFQTQSQLSEAYGSPIAAGEALFSLAEAKLLDEHGGLRRERDILVFDPVHCYGLPGYLQIVENLTSKGWSHRSFWPHGGHLFCLHVVAALGLAGAEVTPFAFYPFNGLFSGATINAGHSTLPNVPGIGFELNSAAWRDFRALF